MEDPYTILGVPKDASSDQIRKAYRELAKKLHPDLNPNDASAEARFKDVSTAYEFLSDQEKREKFDRGEIDADGHEQSERQFYRGFAESPFGGKYAEQEGFANEEDLQAFMSDLFGRRDSQHNIKAKGGSLNYTLEVSFLEAAKGAKKTVTMPDGRSLRINIPPGLRNLQSLRLRNQGLPGYNGGPQGDAYVEIHVRPDPLFKPKKNDIYIELPVSLNEAILGGTIDVPTIDGSVSMSVPKNSNTGTKLRLRGKGLPSRKEKQRGHQYVTLKVVLPQEADEELAAFIGRWAESHPYNPRQTGKAGARS